jgi:Second Messenger Oligonucleotide or Dinucleotide Synthetase domain
MDKLNEEKILESALSNLDISPTDFELAKKRYLSVAQYLESGNYESGNNINIYLQGSFRLGTVIRPYRNKQNADYDIDQVCEINGKNVIPSQLKHDVGDWLNMNENYKRMLDEEGRRCWTLKYASSDGRPGFHLDILPARLENGLSTKINITHKIEKKYAWRSSNPKGYYSWFKNINTFESLLFEEQRKAIYSGNMELYESVKDVPKQLIRTSLQRSIQLLKRHRDVYFDSNKNKPISIIITTICTHKYQKKGVLDSVRIFADYVANRLELLMSGQSLPIDNILDFIDNKWVVKNPTDENENFADKWTQNFQLSKNFFAWIYQLRRDVDAFRESKLVKELNLVSSIVQENISSYWEILTDQMIKGNVESNKQFLDLIHQGIEGKVSWNIIEKLAERNIDKVQDQKLEDTAWVNFYQVKIHSGTGISEKEKAHIKNILSRNENATDFKLCCNLLLGSASNTMLRNCIQSREDEVLSWPIIRLAKNQIVEYNNTIIPEL